MEFIAPMLIMITTALTIGSIWRTAIVNRRMRESARAFVELQTKLIDKFGSAEEVVRYLESSAGQRLLDGQASAPASPHARILDSIHTGILILMGGAGLVVAGNVSDDQVRQTMHVLGMVGVVLGAGYLISAGVSWALLRAWGRLQAPESETAS
jgi:hypothetical protein